MSDSFDDNIFSEILPILNSLDPNSVDKRSIEHLPNDYSNKRSRVASETSLTPIRRHEYVHSSQHSSNKFFSLPGPAGNQDFGIYTDEFADPVTEEYSTVSFKTDCWISAVNSIEEHDLDMNKYPEYDGSIPIGLFLTERFNINKIVQNVSKRAFKLQCLVVMVDSLIVAEPNILIVLSDETGKIKGILYKEDIDLYRNELIPGCVMVLVDVTVYIPIGCEPYVIISRDNVKKIIQNSTLNYNQYI